MGARLIVWCKSSAWYRALRCRFGGSVRAGTAIAGLTAAQTNQRAGAVGAAFKIKPISTATCAGA